MSGVVFGTEERLRQRTSEKWTAFGPDVLPLFVAELDVELAPAVADALHAAVDLSDTGYLGRGRALPEAFVRFAGRRWGWSVAPGSVRRTTDVSVVVVEALRAGIRPGDGVIVTPPVYAPFYEFVPEAGGRVVEVPLCGGVADGWALDLDGIDRAFAAGARALVLCNPHNPLGLVHDRETLEALARIAAAHDALVVSDEIHAPLTHPDARFTPYLSVSDAARSHGIAAHSASKAFNLAGLKCALFVTASERMDDLVAGLPFEVFVRASQFGAIASTAAFDHGDAWLDALLSELVARRRLLGDLLAERLPDVGYREPRASYLAWLDLAPLGWGERPAEVALERAAVALVPGVDFGPGGEGKARLNLGCSEGMLREGVERLAAAAAAAVG